VALIGSSACLVSRGACVVTCSCVWGLCWSPDPRLAASPRQRRGVLCQLSGIHLLGN
jgi:hypothetical protein